MQMRRLGKSGLSVPAIGFGCSATVTGFRTARRSPLAQIQSGLSRVKVEGERYPAALAALVGR
jgi:aryl-alcohol dehydrogenase-like predicted oxidoreductase